MAAQGHRYGPNLPGRTHYPLDLISTVLAAWHQKSLLQVCRDLEKSRSQSMAVSDVGQLERWVQVCPPHAPHTAPLTCADLL